MSSSKLTRKVRGRIKPGTVCVQNFSIFHWPYAPTFDPVDVNQMFDMELHQDGSVTCVAEGFGIMHPFHYYGKGAIEVFSRTK